MEGMGVVYRDPDLETVLALRADTERAGEDQRVADFPVIVIFAATFKDSSLDDSILEKIEPDSGMVPCIMRRHGEMLLPPLLRHMVTMQPFDMGGVHAVFHDLQPVARNHGVADIPDHIVHDEQVVAGQQRSR